ncbi:hypothetical protein PMPD1_1340 [Paramixta manurensis]|uniref:Uncharacterized protein n=1 Tax=Paramixta manurensis TaxID=2740817 RepID=A0A6M8U9A0_9GAMM|nr:hypothetical protein PMPD1_1340 [Erwiniaceae bacterium PD-1]
MTTYLMNVQTKRVASLEEWENTIEDWEDEGGAARHDSLYVEVVKNAEGEWEEVAS